MAQQQLTCSADGTVVNRVTREPVPRAKLTLATPAGYKYATSDASGKWSFSGIACGLGTVTVSRFGFLDQQQAEGAPRAIALSPDSPVHDLTLELLPQSVITGKVADENGDPVMGMSIIGYRARIVEGKRVFDSTTRTMTNDLGEFRLAPLQAGRYIVCAEPPIAQADYQDVCHPAPVETGVGSAITITPGQEDHVEFALSPAHRVRVSGFLSGAPSGARPAVQLARQAEVGAYSRYGVTIRMLSAFVAPDGKFNFESVPAGSYLLNAQLTQDGQFYFARMPIEVGDSDIDNISLAIAPAITISGTVRVDSGQSNSVPRVQVALRSSEPNASMGRVEWNDDRRAFTIFGVSPGNYTLVVSSEQYFVASATLDGYSIVRGEFTISGGPGTMQIVLSDQGGSVEGDVALDNGSPAPTASVMLFRDGKLVRNAL
jgi:hypothetical protein